MEATNEISTARINHIDNHRTLDNDWIPPCLRHGMGHKAYIYFINKKEHNMIPLHVLVCRFLAILIGVINLFVIYLVKRSVSEITRRRLSDSPLDLHSFGFCNTFPVVFMLENRPFIEVMITLSILIIMAFLLPLIVIYWKDLPKYSKREDYSKYKACWYRCLSIGWGVFIFGLAFVTISIIVDFYDFPIFPI